MKRAQKTLLFGLLLGASALFGAAAFFALDGDNGEPVDDAIQVDLSPNRTGSERPDMRTDDVPLGGEPIDYGTRGDGVATEVIFPLEIELHHLRSARFEPAEGVQAIGSGASARLSGHIFDVTGQPASASITFVGGANEGRVLTTDALGGFGAADLYPGIGVVRVQTAMNGLAEREVRLRNGAEDVLNLAFARPAAVYGLVQDRKGEPVSGALVTFDGHESRTDDLGEFHFPQIASGKALVVVHKPGYARYRETVPIAAARTVPKDRLTFVLDPGANLEVSIEENIGARQPARVYCLPAGGQRVNRTAGQRTFPWHLVSPIEVFPGSSARVEDLPEGRINLALFHPGARANPAQASVKLTAGRDARAVLHLAPAPRISGRVVYEGQPIEGARVVLEAPDQGQASLQAIQKRADFVDQMVLPLLPAGRQEVTTDRRGSFAFTIFPDTVRGYYLVADHAGKNLRGQALVGPEELELDIELTPAPRAAGEIAIRMEGRFQGLPVAVKVNGSPRDPFVLAPDEELVLRDLEPGTWRFAATWNGERLSSGRQLRLAEEPAQVVLSLPRGALEGQSPEEKRRAGR